MPDLSHDANAEILKNKLKRDANKSNQSVDDSTIQTDVQPAQTGVPAVNGDSLSQVKPNDKAVPQPSEPVKPEPPADKKPDEPTTSEKPTAPPTEEPSYKWDEGITASQTEPVVEPTNFSKLSSALNLEVKSEDELVKTVKEKFNKLAELEAQSLDSVPDQLKEAVQLAKKGGDWESLISVTALDASKLDPVALFKRQYEQSNYRDFLRQDGTFDDEKFDQEWASIPNGMKKMQGELIKNQIVSQQNQRRAMILAQTAQRQESFQKSLGEAAKELSNLLPQDVFGITLEAKHAAYMYQGIADGTLVRKHLGDVDLSSLSKADGKRLMKTIALAELGERISKHQFEQGKVAGKKDLLKQTQNPVIKTPDSLPRPNEPVEQPKTRHDYVKEQRDRIKPANSL